MFVNARHHSEEIQKDRLQANLLIGQEATGVENQSSGSASTSTTIVHKPHRDCQGIKMAPKVVRDYLLSILVEAGPILFQDSFGVETHRTVGLLSSSIIPFHYSRCLSRDQLQFLILPQRIRRLCETMLDLQRSVGREIPIAKERADNDRLRFMRKVHGDHPATSHGIILRRGLHRYESVFSAGSLRQVAI